MATDVHQLEALFSVISDRKGDDPKNSYTASLFAKGVGKCAQKLGEEAVERSEERRVGKECRSRWSP